MLIEIGYIFLMPLRAFKITAIHILCFHLIKAGAAIVGGCCGTTEKHIKALSDATRGMELHRPLASHRRILASERKNVEVGLDGNFLVVGERINPTGKKKLQAQLREGKLDLDSAWSKTKSVRVRK